MLRVGGKVEFEDGSVVVAANYDPVAWLGRKIRRQTKKTSVEAAVQPAP